MDLTEATLAVLNKLHESDPEACSELFAKRVVINGAIAADPKFSAREKKGGKHEIGSLSVINAILISTGSGRVLPIKDDNGTIMGFVRQPLAKAAVVPLPPPAPK